MGENLDGIRPISSEMVLRLFPLNLWGNVTSNCHLKFEDWKWRVVVRGDCVAVLS